jgi:hypothetical protein
METTIITALIGVAGTLLSPTIAPIVNEWKERNHFGRVDPHVVKILTKSQWSGSLQDYFRGDGQEPTEPQKLIVAMEKNRFTNTITGTIKLNRPGSTEHIVLERGVVRDRSVLLLYRNVQKEKNQVGAIIFHLSDDAKRLEGLHCGWSPFATPSGFQPCLVGASMTLTQE